MSETWFPVRVVLVSHPTIVLTHALMYTSWPFEAELPGVLALGHNGY